MQESILTIGNVEVTVKFKPIKNLHLSVHPPDGNVTVSSPDFFDLEKVRIYLITKLSWIKRQQSKILSQDREGGKSYITKESHFYLGKRYLLRIIESDRIKIELKHSTILLYVAKDASTQVKKDALYRWYRKQLRGKVDELVAKYALKMELDIPKFKIQKLKTKWGSCSTRTQQLLFNIELVKKPIGCIEYIVVHEMVHLIERSHNKNFISLMNFYLPNWRIQKRILNELPI